jgi:hypothetical protein
MALTVATVLNGILYGTPPVFLLFALLRSFRTARRAVPVYFIFLAGWLAHLALRRPGASGLPASVHIAPPDAVPAPPLQIADAEGRNVLQLQAPASLDWTLQGNERRLRFHYGFMAAAYGQGTTNGAGVTVTLRREGVSRIIFRRALDPRGNPGDRGVQQADLVLPPVARGEQLSLTFDPGAAGDAAWDWLFVSDLDFARAAAFLPDQFPSFRRAPDIVDAPLATLWQRQERPFFLQLHAPARFEYVLHGGEQKVSFCHGFLSGAFQGGNATDGARFVVELRTTSGAARTLFDRELDPLKRQQDRGPQPAEFSLGAGTAGDRLVFRIEPGRSGSNAWDWTYFSRLSVD